MIRFDNFEVVGLEPAIRGMRNPKNSWKRSDSLFFYDGDTGYFITGEADDESGHEPDEDIGYFIGGVHLGSGDRHLMTNLAKNGSVHAKYRRMIVVYVDIIAPLYWWKEFDTYKVGTVSNSCSTMHTIADKLFTREDFSYEHLGVITKDETGDTIMQNLWIESLKKTIEVLNIARRFYFETEDPVLKKQYWWQMIQLLPTSYNQKRTIMLNYEVLANIYKSRKNHKLDEWHRFCDWIEQLPYSSLITV